jgi:tyrosyl-tRNA synthetase
VVPAYIGYDATAVSLHVGHLLNIMMLRWLQKTGHKPITLMGGGTTKVGDPSFRSDERPLLTPAQIDDNIAGIKQVFSPYVPLATADRRDHAEQCRMAGRAELPRFPARHRAAFQRQPDAEL